VEQEDSRKEHFLVEHDERRVEDSPFVSARYLPLKK